LRLANQLKYFIYGRMWLGDKSGNNGPSWGGHLESVFTKEGDDIYGVGLSNRVKHGINTTVVLTISKQLHMKAGLIGVFGIFGIVGLVHAGALGYCLNHVT